MAVEIWPELMTVRDAAQATQKSEATIRAWERTGRLRAYRTASGMRIFRREDVLALLESREATQVAATR